MLSPTDFYPKKLQGFNSSLFTYSLQTGQLNCLFAKLLNILQTLIWRRMQGLQNTWPHAVISGSVISVVPFKHIGHVIGWLKLIVNITCLINYHCNGLIRSIASIYSAETASASSIKWCLLLKLYFLWTCRLLNDLILTVCLCVCYEDEEYTPTLIQKKEG